MRSLISAAVLAGALVVVPVSTAPANGADDAFFQYPDQDDKTFYPLVHDHFRDFTTLYYVTSDEVMAERWTVTDALGEVIRDSGTYGYSMGQVSWAGRNDAGDLMPPGTYTLSVTAEQSPVGTEEGQELSHTLTRSVTIATDSVTVKKRVRYVPGAPGTPYWDKARATGSCTASKSYQSALLDCRGYGRAWAKYSFYLPTRGEEPGAGMVRNVRVSFSGDTLCCAPGRVTRKITHPRRHIYVGVVKVTGWRAFRINAFRATYQYTKRR